MHIYFSGIGGAGLAPLAEIAHDAGYDVSGSDLHESLASIELEKRSIDVIYEQSVESMAAEHLTNPIDWFVYTSALPPDHPELAFARKNGIRVSKRDEFLAEFIAEKRLKLIAVAGTHGKTTTTAMLTWLFSKLKIPASYLVGTTLSFASTGRYDKNSEYFIYECDEYDRNFLKFSPELSLITRLDYDHADTYPSIEDYKEAFADFIEASTRTLMWKRDYDWLGDYANENTEVFEHTTTRDEIDLPGQAMRDNAFLAKQIMLSIDEFDEAKLDDLLARFPGTTRRFEKLANNLYTDYAHHPTEIAATIALARELNPRVVVVYQPHQNSRQHEVANAYKDAFQDASKVYWTPTYLVRENPDLDVLTPNDLISKLANPDVAQSAELNDELWKEIEEHRAAGELVVFMGAGPIDAWLREKLANS